MGLAMLGWKERIHCLVRGCLVALTAFFVVTSLFAAEVTETKTAGAILIIDTHAHILRDPRRGSPAAMASQVLRAMDDQRVEMTIFLPPPFPPDHPGMYGRPDLELVARRNPGRFAFVAGGESLNPMIHQVAPDKVTPGVIRKFQQEAEAIVKAGAAGFGEFAAEHFSSGRGGHPYESTIPDHPLLLALADIAAQYGMPIDLHMEAVPEDMPLPGRLAGRGNPSRLKENITGFERLLAHNRGARIVWAHAGWDLTGERTVALMRSLLTKHPNLYMSVKLDPNAPRRTSPFGSDGTVRPDWLSLLREFADRFLIGSDQFFDEGTERLSLARKFVDALPPDVVIRIARENAKHVYRLNSQAK